MGALATGTGPLRRLGTRAGANGRSRLACSFRASASMPWVPVSGWRGEALLVPVISVAWRLEHVQLVVFRATTRKAA